MPEFDLAAIYRTARERLVALAPQLSATQLETIVPTCPAWTVQDVYAHLAGGSADIDTRDVAAPTSEEQTALQVETRRGHAIGQLTAEWRGNGPAVERMLAARSDSVLSIDAWTHDQDIHNALNLVSGRDGEGLELVVNAVWRLKRRLRASGVSSFRIVTERRDWVIGDTAPAATLTSSPSCALAATTAAAWTPVCAGGSG